MSVAVTDPRDRILFRMRSYQRKSFLARQQGCRRFYEILHRRAGKDRNWLNLTYTEAMVTRGVYFHVFPSLNQGRRDLWDNIVQERIDGVTRRFPMLDMFPPEHVVPGSRNENEMQLTLVSGSIWQIMGADSKEAIARLRGPNPCGIVLSEWPHMDSEAWDVLSPVLTENGGWVAFIGTPNGKNHGYTMHRSAVEDPTWFSQLLTIEDTKRDAVGEDGSPVIALSEIEDLRRHGMREERIQQEYYCSFEGYSHGTIYGDVLSTAYQQERVARVPYDSRRPVGVCLDIGHSDAMALWFYQLPDDDPLGRVHWIDYEEATQKNMQWVVHLLREAKPYVYGKITLPWDGLIAQEYLHEVGFERVFVTPRTKSVQAEIDVIRRAFNRFYFDSVLCRRGIECLENYSMKWEDAQRVFAPKPMHDQWSHGADALRTGVAGGLGPMPGWRAAKNYPIPPASANSWMGS